ncbi:LuxR C-terminal-related transcriptional regulator [Micromonospora sp. WMMD1128]|uniref:LuxR C-terminal-related transcriptional regulator n=1 Tax=Micromonospora sp. WMMD1128 TaxID=3015150 RepID=UPI00248C37AF|nr:LuxR C-terminal-related transcriptional regulator [Micromonospora sp. WMMD1128]WBB75103.1 LuxR C-terminal-related transcriptional regulator [Micromonospora sp. WMMD1128]
MTRVRPEGVNRRGPGNRPAHRRGEGRMPQEADRARFAAVPPGAAAPIGTAAPTGTAAPSRAAVPSGAAGPPLLASRLAPPPPPEPALLRPRLVDRLERGVAGPVTLLRAPAGWGKTTLLSGWARARSGPAPVWVSVADGDTAGRLWAYLAAALRTAVAGNPDDGPPPPVPDGPPRPEQLEALAAALAEREHQVLLVLDDLHRVTDPAALAGLEFLLRHGDGRLRLVAAARREPQLSLHRWRLAGELTVLGPDELSFTADEAADLLVAHGVPVPAEAVARLTSRTAGWPAGLRFAALTLGAGVDPARAVDHFTGDQPDVAAYLRGEVLAPLEPAARDVLRLGAVTVALHADLAVAVTGRADAGRLLAEAAREGGFVQSDGGSPPWYRPHPLLADLLRDELGRLPADELRELHRRAASWFAAHDRPAEALRHALAAGEWADATDLLITRWPELAPGEPDRAAAPAPPEPPAEAVRRDPELALAAAAERAYAGDPAAADGQLRRAVAHAAGLPAPRRDRFRRLATAVEVSLARLAGDHQGVRRAADRLLATAPTVSGGPATPTAPGAPTAPTAPTAPGGPGGPGVDPRAGSVDADDVRAVAGAALGLVALAEGDLSAAGGWFGTALAAARRAGRPRTELLCASRSAVLEAARGALRTAEEHARAALSMPPCQGWSSRADCGYAYLALAFAAWHRDRPAEAAAHLALAGPAGAEPGGAALAALCRAGLLADGGEPAAASRTLTAARTVAPGGELAAWLTAGEAQLRAAAGDLGGARALLDASGGEPTDPALALASARLWLRSGDSRAAERALPDWTDPAATGWPLPVRLGAGLLDAALAGAAGDGRRAGRLLEEVLALAEPEGCRRVFTRAEPGVRDLLATHRDTGTAYWATVDDLVRDVDARRADGTPEVPARGLDEPLTEREVTVLRYLQSILTNVEIAAELSLSVNTVKTHVRNIYRKLDATRRREAVRRARELRLI